jgi:hypothetical protein
MGRKLIGARPTQTTGMAGSWSSAPAPASREPASAHEAVAASKTKEDAAEAA